MEGDFDTGNVRYKARERYSFGVSARGIFGVEVRMFIVIYRRPHLLNKLVRYMKIFSQHLNLILTQDLKSYLKTTHNP